MDEQQYIKPSDAAKRLGVTRQAIYKWINEGRLEGVRFGIRGAVRIPAASLERFERDARNKGRGDTIEDSRIALAPAA